MHYEDAKRIGDEGEKRVADELRRLQTSFGFKVMPNIMIGTQSKGGLVTAELDHVVVDKFGALIVETKVRRRASVRGTSVQTKWTACYPGGKNYTFQNPISQNDQHVALLYQLLKHSMPELELERVRGVVVFVDADISKLDLDSVGEVRVTSSDVLESWFAARQDFVIAQPLSAQDQAALTAAVLSLDRKEDPQFSAAHAAYRSGPQNGMATPPKPTPQQQRPAGPQTQWQPRPQPVSKRPYQAPANRPAPTADGAPRLSKVPLLLAVGIVALGLGAWALYQIQSGAVPAWVWGLVLLFAAGLIGDESSGRRRRRRKRSTPAPSFGARLASLMAGLLVLFLVSLSLPWFFSRMFVPAANGSALMAPAVPATSDVPAAKKALQDVAPNIYGALLDEDAPAISQDGAGVAYEWEYLEKSGKDSVVVKTIRITLDAGGNIIATRMP